MTSRCFPKSERVVSQKLLQELFGGANTHSMVVFPLRAVYLERERPSSEDAAIQLLISVSKRHFHHAVDRNRVKRQLREAYRLNRQLLTRQVPANRQLVVALIWLSDSLATTDTVASRVRTLLKRMSGKLYSSAQQSGSE